MGCCGVSHLQVVKLPAWHTVYSSGKYEVSRGFSLRLVFFVCKAFSSLLLSGSPRQFIFSSEHTVYPPAFFSLCVRNSFLLRFFCAKFFFRPLLRENCLVARCVRKLTYKLLVIQCIIIGAVYPEDSFVSAGLSMALRRSGSVADVTSFCTSSFRVASCSLFSSSDPEVPSYRGTSS